jgi:hypothetical protein
MNLCNLTLKVTEIHYLILKYFNIHSIYSFDLCLVSI